MLELSIYPVAPATMQPMTKPTIIDAFFRNGEPNSSTRRMLTKDRKPRPMNWGEPHLQQGVRVCESVPGYTYSRGRGAAMSGQS